MKLKRYSWLYAMLMAAILASPMAAQASYRLVEVQGTVQIKRRWRFNYRPARQGMTLRLGDSLRTGPGSQARIQCDDLNTVWPMSSNLTRGVASGCPIKANDDLRVGRQNDNAPGGNDQDIPYIISPRRTAVLDSQLELRWNPVPGATEYTVQLIGPDVHWEMDVNEPQVTYPDVSSLSPAKDYRVIIESDTGSSSQEDTGSESASFQVMYENDVALVQEKIATLSNQNFSREAHALALADIYIREDLLADAIDALEPLVTDSSGYFEVYKTLGDLYRYIGLNLLAETRYEKAIALAEIDEDLEGKSAAQAGLAEVKLMLGAPQNVATELLSEALEGYKAVLENHAIPEEDDPEKEIQNKLLKELEDRIEDIEDRLECFTNDTHSGLSCN